MKNRLFRSLVTFVEKKYQKFVATLQILKFLKEKGLLLVVLTAEVIKRTREFLKTELFKSSLLSLILVFYNKKLKEYLDHLPNEYLGILFVMLVFIGWKYPGIMKIISKVLMFLKVIDFLYCVYNYTFL